MAREKNRAKLEAIAGSSKDRHSTIDAALYRRPFDRLRKISGMCGICGIVNISGERQPESVRLRVNAMLQALSHRGPDDVGLNASESAVLGATRLAIRGGDDGRQPMVDAASGVVAVCNGEIDNHKELRRWLAERGRPVKQATDVAVIPGMYLELGEAFAEKLVGAFAIAVWDPRERRLTLVRDRAGNVRCFSRKPRTTSFSPRRSPALFPSADCR